MNYKYFKSIIFVFLLISSTYCKKVTNDKNLLKKASPILKAFWRLNILSNTQNFESKDFFIEGSTFDCSKNHIYSLNSVCKQTKL
ncbi:MAG: hypothetical protein GY830_07190 [Bacteroidetes bacterium]|nr:hypothetical protein [Bacteroidota bacterium]